MLGTSPEENNALLHGEWVWCWALEAGGKRLHCRVTLSFKFQLACIYSLGDTWPPPAACQIV